MKLLRFSLLLTLLVTIVSFTGVPKQTVSKKENTPVYVGKFTWCNDDDYCFILYVYVDETDNTTIVQGGVAGIPTTYYSASGTYSFSGGVRSVSGFVMSTPYGVATYSGNLTYP